MAEAATIYNFSIDLADMDRGVYETLELRVARHPSETAEYMLVRVLAYCLEYQEGISLTEGVSSGDEPALLVRDLTGRVIAWIEVGMPDAARLHRGSKHAGRVAVYTHRDTRQSLALSHGRLVPAHVPFALPSPGEGSFMQSSCLGMQHVTSFEPHAEREATRRTRATHARGTGPHASFPSSPL